MEGTQPAWQRKMSTTRTGSRQRRPPAPQRAALQKSHCLPWIDMARRMPDCTASAPRRVITILFLLASASCSHHAAEQPTEEDLHAGDAALPSAVHHHHVFKCDDGSLLLVDFLHGGLTISVSLPGSASRLLLTAPSQGSAFVGTGTSATMEGRGLRIRQSKGASYACVRQSAG